MPESLESLRSALPKLFGLCAEGLFSDGEQGSYVVILAQKFASFESLHLQFDEEVDVRFFRSEMLHQIVSRLHGSTCGTRLSALARHFG